MDELFLKHRGVAGNNRQRNRHIESHPGAGHAAIESVNTKSGIANCVFPTLSQLANLLAPSGEHIILGGGPNIEVRPQKVHPGVDFFARVREPHFVYVFPC